MNRVVMETPRLMISLNQKAFGFTAGRRKIVLGEKELNHDQSNTAQRQQTLLKHVQLLPTASQLGAFELFTLLTAHFI